MVTERKIIKDVVNRYLLKEYVMKTTERAGFGGIDIQRNPMGTLVTLIAERPGMVIGHRGKTIKELTAVMEHRFKFDNPQIEVEEEKNPNLNSNIMAHKLAVALERGWHFRRAGHSTVRKIMGSGARGCQVILAGKITGERHRTEKFKDGHIKYCGETALQTMEIGYAVAKKKLGTIGIKVMIMRPDAVLPDEITILTQEQAKGIVPEAIVEELKIDTTIQEEVETDIEPEDDAAEIVETLIEQSEKKAAKKIPKAEPAMADAEITETEAAAEAIVDEPVVEEPAEPSEEKITKKPAKKAAKKPAKKATKAKPKAKKDKAAEPESEVGAEVADTEAAKADEPEVKAEVEKPKPKKAAVKKAPAKKKAAATKKAPAKKKAATKKATAKKEVKEPTEKAVKEPSEKTVKEPAEKAAKEPSEKAVKKPSKKAVKKPTGETVKEPADESADAKPSDEGKDEK